MSWSENLKAQVEQAASARSPLSADAPAPLKHLQQVDHAPALYRMNGFGVGLYGWLRDPRLEPDYLKVYFLTALWIPILPLGAYVVQRAGNGFRFYGRMSLWGLVRTFGWRTIPLYASAFLEGAGLLVLFLALIICVALGVSWLRHQL